MVCARQAKVQLRTMYLKFMYFDFSFQVVDMKPSAVHLQYFREVAQGSLVSERKKNVYWIGVQVFFVFVIRIGWSFFYLS